MERRANPIEQSVEMRQTIKLMPMNHQVTLPINCPMNRPFHKADGAEAQPEKLLQELIMVPGDQCDLRMLAMFSQQLLDEHIILLRPVPSAAQLPAVNKVANDIKLLALYTTEQLQEFTDLRVPRPKVNIRNP